MKRAVTLLWSLLIIMVLLATGLPATPALGATPNLTVNFYQQYQTIDGMGVNINVNSWENGLLKPALDALIDVNGSSLFRVVRDPMDWVSSESLITPLHDLDDATLKKVYEAPKMQDIWNTIGYLNQKGIRGDQIDLNFQGWTPTWLGGSGGVGVSHITAGKESALATMIASLVYYGRRVKGLDFTLLAPLNESEGSGKDGPLLEVSQYVTAISLLVNELDYMGLTEMRLVIPDTYTSSTNSYISGLMSNPVIASRTDHLGFHKYGASTGLLPQYPSVNDWITEGADWDSTLDMGGTVSNEWSFSRNSGDYILADLKIGWSAFITWDGYSSIYVLYTADKLSGWGLLAYDMSTGLYTPRKRFYMNTQINRFIRPGMKVVDISGLSSSLGNTVAVYNQTTGEFSIVGHNTGSSSFTINGQLQNVPIVIDSLALYETNQSINLQRQPDVAVADGTFSVSIPADTFFSLTNIPVSFDLISPTVSIVSHQNDARVSGIVTLTADASDNDGVFGVQFVLDGTTLGSEATTAPYSISWDTSSTSDGAHVLSALARDASGNEAVSSIDITVANGIITTFGLDDGNISSNDQPGYLSAARFRNVVGTGDLTKIELLFDDSSPSGQVRLGVYADNNGSPGSLLLDAGEVTATNGWVAISRLNLPVTQDVYYWLAYSLQSGNTIRYQNGRAENSNRWIKFTYGALPSTYPNGSSSDNIQPVIRATVASDSSPSPNNIPVASPDSYSVNEDEVLGIAAPGVLFNDSDDDHDTLTAAVVVAPSHGTLALQADGSFSYSPDDNFNGSDSFTYHAYDGKDYSNTATVSLTVNPVNDAPVAVNETYSATEDTGLTVAAPGVLGNDTDVENDPLTAAVVDVPASGVLALNADGSFTYTPNAGFTGSDSFTYVANDGNTESNVATAYISVTVAGGTVEPEPTTATFGLDGGNISSNDLPNYLSAARFQNTAGTGSLTKIEILFDDTSPTGKVRLGVYADNNGSPGSLLLNAGEVTVTNGWVAISQLELQVTQNAYYWLAYSLQSGNTLRYQSRRPSNSNRWVKFTYGAFPSAYPSGSSSDSSQTVMRATVSTGSPLPPNNAPVASADSYSVDEDGMLSVGIPGVLGNDSDADKDILTAAVAGNPAHGTLALQADGSFTYTPKSDFSGSDSFTYRAYDGKDYSNTATVSLTVNPVNDAPVAVNDTYSATEDTGLTVTASGVLGNDTDADGDTLTAILVSDVSHGSLTLNGDGSFIYTPGTDSTGTDSFTYQAYDGVTDSNTATVTITVTDSIATFGLNNGNSTTNKSPNVLEVMRFQNTAGTGTLTELELLFDDTTPTGKVRLGVYADNNGRAGNLLLDAGEVNVANGWVSINGLSLPVTQNTYYWLAFNLQSTNRVRYQSRQATRSHYWYNYTYGTFPTQYPGSGRNLNSDSSPSVMRAIVIVSSP
jgi:VCBS repeat-containing protein